MTKIPIQNIYYIVLYAWNKVKHKQQMTHLHFEDIETVNDVVVDLFITEVTRITQKGLYGEYLADDHETGFIKGKINIRESLRLTKPTLNCRYDEFSQDHLINQLLKTTLKHLFFMRGIKEKDKKKIRWLLLNFQQVNELNLTDYSFRMVQYNRLNQDYEFAIDLAYLIHEHSIPTEERAVNKFIAIHKNEERMSAIYEEFIRNFYRINSPYNVHSRHYSWDLDPIESSDIALLPRMETDVEIEKMTEKIIIDTKYYQDAFNFREKTQKFKSPDLYQMSAYLRKNSKEVENRALKGILLYPTNGYEFHEKYQAQEGYQLELKSINLNQDWWRIEEELMNLIS